MSWRLALLWVGLAVLVIVTGFLLGSHKSQQDLAGDPGVFLPTGQ